jgi:hypothetical protein
MKIPRVKSWVRLVLCYWLFMSVIFFFELRYMDWGWAGLLGFLFTLPFSTLVVTGYFLASYAAEFQGYNIHVTDYHAEYGFMICAFINGFMFYPFYYWWVGRKQARVYEPPPPPNHGMHATADQRASHR